MNGLGRVHEEVLPGRQPAPTASNVYGYTVAQTLVQVLKQCGDDLTRENVMKQAASLKDFDAGHAAARASRSTPAPTDFAPIESVQLMRFDGKQWVRFGDVDLGRPSSRVSAEDRRAAIAGPPCDPPLLESMSATHRAEETEHANNYRCSPQQESAPLCLVAFAIGLALLVSRPVAAEITQIMVNSVNNIGPFRGKSYREVQLTMKGVAPGGAYSVPVVLAFPNVATEYNGFAVIDVLNTVTVRDPKYVLGGRIFSPSPAPTWEMSSSSAADMSMSGLSGTRRPPSSYRRARSLRPADRYEIWRDAARLARNPAGSHFPPGFSLPRAADKVIAFGFSQTGMLLRGFYSRQLNTRYGDLTFDGALITGAGGGCRTWTTRARHAKGRPPGGKVIAVNAEGDTEWGGFDERGETRDYGPSRFQAPSHIPSSLVDFRGLGALRQNPVGAFPVYRAALANLQRWIGGTEPPPSIYITLREGPPEDLLGDPLRPAVHDADGNALGGVRLPHLRTTLPGGKVVGAPLGTYNGLDLAFKDTNDYFLISGTFAPFAPDRLRALYRTREAYVSAVAEAAKDLVAKRYLLQEDADTYVEAAARQEIGR